MTPKCCDAFPDCEHVNALREKLADAVADIDDFERKVAALLAEGIDIDSGLRIRADIHTEPERGTYCTEPSRSAETVRHDVERAFERTHVLLDALCEWRTLFDDNQVERLP